jgi:transcription initiation factor TFIIE subunit alpha
MAEKANVLVRSVVRSFYDTDHIVVMDAIINHSCVSLEDLRGVLVATGRSNKDIAKVCGRLREGGLLAVYVHQETRGNATKASNVEYFFVNQQKAVDATKYRIYTLEEKIRKHARPTTEKKEFSCPRCKSQYTQIEVLDEMDPLGRGSGFLCKKCGAVLDYHPHNRDAEPDGDNTLKLFNNQFGHIIKLLRELEDLVVPEITGEQSFLNRRPVPKDSAPLALAPLPPLDQPKMRPTAVMGVKSGPEKVEITLTTDSEYNAAAQVAETERKARLAQQNQLPEWHTHSTVSNEITALGHRESAANQDTAPTAQTFKEETEDQKESDAMFASFLVALEEEKRRKALEEAEEDEDDDDDDDDEFEDVDVPAPDAKRVKIEDTPLSTPAAAVTNGAASANGDDGESDADDDFEDVV